MRIKGCNTIFRIVADTKYTIWNLDKNLKFNIIITKNERNANSKCNTFKYLKLPLSSMYFEYYCMYFQILCVIKLLLLKDLIIFEHRIIINLILM